MRKDWPLAASPALPARPTCGRWPRSVNGLGSRVQTQDATMSPSSKEVSKGWARRPMQPCYSVL